MADILLIEANKSLRAMLAITLANAGQSVLQTADGAGHRTDLDHRATDPGTRYPTDHLHFGTAGTLELGRRMAEKMHAALALAK